MLEKKNKQNRIETVGLTSCHRRHSFVDFSSG